MGEGPFPAPWLGSSDSTDVATLAVQAGAFLISDYGLIGEGPGNHGRVNVVGTDSEWLTRFNLNVGESGGDGELIVMNGGTVSGTFMRVGNGFGSNGNVTVQGTDAVIAMAGEIFVGAGGLGAISIVVDGLVEANSMTIDSSSGVSIQRGELRANTINNGGQISLNGFSPSLITGSVINEPTGSVVIQGTDAVFSGAVENNGVGIETSFGSCTFAGGLSGTSPLTGNGTVRFQGPIQPGNGTGAINIENDVFFDPPASSIFELGGTSANQHDRLVIGGDCQLGGELQVEFVNGHSLNAGNQYLIVEIGGNATGTFDGWLEGDVVAIANGNILRISYVGGDGNDVVLIGEPGRFVVVPEVANISQGSLVSGTVSDLTQSDNSDLSIQRSTTSIQAITEFTAVATSPTDQPKSLVVKLEGSVFARTPVNQFVELFDYQLNRYELIGSNTATRFTDSTIELTVSGDLSRFVQPDTKRMIPARIRYQSLNSRQAFASQHRPVRMGNWFESSQLMKKRWQGHKKSPVGFSQNQQCGFFVFAARWRRCPVNHETHKAHDKKRIRNLSTNSTTKFTKPKTPARFSSHSFLSWLCSRSTRH